MDLQGTKFELFECCYVNHKAINKYVHKLITNTNVHVQTNISTHAARQAYLQQ